MTILVAIVFIAELIIAGALIVLILSADKKVLALNVQTAAIAPVIEKSCVDLRLLLQRTRKTVTFLGRTIKYNKRFNRIKNIVLTAISLSALLKNPLTYVSIKEREDKKMNNNKAFAFGMGLLAGVVGGIIAGVLYAPKPGEESRRELKEAAEKLYEDHSPAIAQAKQQAAEAIEVTKYKLENQFKKVRAMVKSDKVLKAKERETKVRG